MIDLIDDAALQETMLSEEAVFDGRLLHVRRMTVRLPNGKTSTRERIIHPGASAVVVLDDEGRIVLERQWRAPMNRAFWEIPAGKLDPQEGDFACAKRELAEETGLAARRWTRLGTIHNAIGYSNERIILFLARDLDETGVQKLDDNEFLQLVRMPFDEALAMTQDGRITDVKTIIGLNWCRQYLDGLLLQAEDL